MLKETDLLKLKITTLKKKIAMQIQEMYFLSRDEWNAANTLGWIKSRSIGWRTITGIAILCERNNRYFWIVGSAHVDGAVYKNRIISRQIFIA